MTKRPLTRVYFEWLTEQIRVGDRPNDTYSNLFLQLYNIEFVWLVAWDNNRIADAMDLRSEFVQQVQGTGKGSLEFPCSVLEVIIALSRRLEFVTGSQAPDWAWVLLVNLGLDEFSDPYLPSSTDQVQEICENLIFRKYKMGGRGGFFPLHNAHRDQTKIEIWHQMADYLEENQLY